MTTNQSTSAKRVWILGAGFSRPLGGPLMSDFFTLLSVEQAATWFSPVAAVKVHCLAAAILFQFGAGKRDQLVTLEPRDSGEIPAIPPVWTDAEAYMRILEIAQSDPAEEAMIRHLQLQIRRLYKDQPGIDEPGTSSVKDLHAAAKSMIAASCLQFMRTTTQRQAEPWMLYKTWANTLTTDDTIISFNYDLVLEELSDYIKIWIPGLPASYSCLRGRAKALKLHGSLGWKTNAKGGIDACGIDDAINGATMGHLVFPGLNKSSAVKVLSEMWDEAETALKGAEQIISIGYRYATNDVSVLQWLTQSLQRRDSRFSFTSVLGPSGDNAADKVRVQHWISAVASLQPFAPTEMYWPPNSMTSWMFPGWTEEFLLMWPSLAKRFTGDKLRALAQL